MTILYTTNPAVSYLPTFIPLLMKAVQTHGSLRSITVTLLELVELSQMLSTIFKNLNISKAYERLQKEYPQALTELKELFDAAIKRQGECGQLLVISLPEELAEQCTYSTDPEGRPNYHYLVNKKLTTTSTIALAKNHDLADFKNQHTLILIEQILNPKVAQKAYVTIKSFDPVAYWRTEKYCAFEKKLDEVVELLKKLETKP